MYRQSGTVKVIYFDNENHVIHYQVTLSENKNTITFLGETVPGMPRFRLTYIRENDNTLSLKFDVAPPGNRTNFPNISVLLKKRK